MNVVALYLAALTLCVILGAAVVILGRELQRADDRAAFYRAILDKHHIPYDRDTR